MSSNRFSYHDMYVFSLIPPHPSQFLRIFLPTLTVNNSTHKRYIVGRVVTKIAIYSKAALPGLLGEVGLVESEDQDQCLFWAADILVAWARAAAVQCTDLMA